MTQPVGGANTPQNFDFQRLQKIVSLVGAEDTPFKAVDVSDVGKAAPPSGANQEVIVFKPGAQLEKSVTPDESKKLAADLKDKGVNVGDQLSSVGGVTASLDKQQSDSLKQQGYVLFDNRPRNLVPDFPGGDIFMADNPIEMPHVDPVAMTRADQVQAQGANGQGQTVCVIDSGFDHPGFNLAAYKDFVDDSSQESDPVGHGTHVTGDVHQLAPDAKIAVVRVMNGDGQGRPSDIIRGIDWAIQNKDRYGIDEINMSLGGDANGTPSEFDPIDRAVEQAIQSGITVVSAAGNSGPKEGTIGSPGNDPLGISVGSALNPTTVSTFSSRGPTDDGISKPDVTAPGEYIVSWTVPGSQMDKMGHVVETLRHMPDDKLVQLLTAKPQLIDALKLPKDILDRSPAERDALLQKALPPIYMPDSQHIAAPGTSFASPITAGIVADLKSADPALPPQAVKDVLTSTADPMDAKFGPNDDGAGFIDAARALSAVRQRAAAEA